MATLQELFKEAFRLWHVKSPDEPPKHGYPTYDHFERLRKELETKAILLGFGGLKVKASVGMGSWAEIPWIGMRNPYLTDNFEEGEYVVYLFAPNYDRLFLGLIQGVTHLTSGELAERTPRLRKKIVRPDDFYVGINGRLSKNTLVNSKPDKYERGLLYSKKYDIPLLSSDEVILTDLKAALSSYRDYVNKSIE